MQTNQTKNTKSKRPQKQQAVWVPKQHAFPTKSIHCVCVSLLFLVEWKRETKRCERKRKVRCKSAPMQSTMQSMRATKEYTTPPPSIFSPPPFTPLPHATTSSEGFLSLSLCLSVCLCLSLVFTPRCLQSASAMPCLAEGRGPSCCTP